ncbi:MAG: tRNA cyclic N6-threonylcarbamoyladenosine(37) synthase TcdA [Gammaproteobacteria bacterium]
MHQSSHSSSSLSLAYRRRFAGIARLYGDAALNALFRAHFCVIGLGGVGTWTAEALVRSGVGALTLIDLDEVCISNTNRQLHALDNLIGQSKVNVLCDRLLHINPELRLTPIEDFISLDNIPTYIGPEHDVVIDAIDMAHTKSGLIAYCLARKIRVVTVGSAGGKRDPSQVTHGDLARTERDPLLAKVRHDLFRTYRFARDRHRRFRVDAIFSPESVLYPQADGSVCPQKRAVDTGVKLDCEGGFGACTMVTGSFGFLAASRAIHRFLAKHSLV